MTASRKPPLTIHRLRRLALKELREILRDRRTIITLVLMPMLVYPLIGMTLQKFLVTQMTDTPQIEYRLGYRDEFTARTLIPLWRRDRGQSPAQGTEDDPILKHVAPDHSDKTLDFSALIEEGVIDLGLAAKQAANGGIQVELVTQERSAIGRNARRFAEQRFGAANAEFLQAELRRLNSRVQTRYAISSTTLPAEAGAAKTLATLIPLILILMTVTGAVYPAIDLTAGERERGTLEALISTPVPRRDLLLAKYVAVLSVAVLTAMANLAAMTVTAYITGLESLLFGADGLTWMVILKVLCVLTVFAGFFSAVLLAVTSFARSFKEAQAYLIPVMLVSIAPGILSLMPGLQLSWGLSLTPLANMVLVTRDLFEGRRFEVPALLAMLSTVAYTWLALGWAVRVFGTDAVLYGSSGSWSDLWERPEEAATQPTATQVLGCLAAVLPLFLLLGRMLSNWVNRDLNMWVIGQVMLTTLLFVGLPVAWSWWQRVSITKALMLRPACWPAFAAATLAGLSLWPFAYEALLFALPVEQLEKLLEKFAGIEEKLNLIPFGVQLVVLAIVPAITEELFFRGFLLQGLARDWGRWPAIFASAAVFGVFHVFVQGLSFERFIPTGLLGICLGWVFARSGSVWPGMLLHVLHNSLLLTLSQFKDQLQAAGIGIEEQSHLPAVWLVTAGIAVAVAIRILARVKPQDEALA